jgi:hypothetical protein
VFDGHRRRERHERQDALRPGCQPAVYAAIGVDLAGQKDVLRLWAGAGGEEPASFWLRCPIGAPSERHGLRSLVLCLDQGRRHFGQALVGRAAFFARSQVIP